MTKARDISKLLSTANGKIAGENLNVSFENITDTGTTGTRVATGTSAQRGSTAGQLRFNSDTGLAEYYDGSQFKAIDVPPTVTAISPTEVASLDGGDATFTITGTNFQNGIVVKFIGNDGTSVTASPVTVNSNTSITAVAPNSSFSNSKEPYDIQVINTNNLSGNLNNQIYIDNTVSWNTASGTIASINTVSTGTHATVSATDPDGDTVSYSETGGTVLSTAGLTLNSATGAISGTPNSGGTLNFTLRATANSKTADRAFSITVIEAYNADFLVVAGGGGGAAYHYAGGGGAGGYRSSYNSESSGGGASAETSLIFEPSIVYTITVGAGGAGGLGDGAGSATGSTSSISGSNITTISTVGGGYGGHGNTNNGNGGDGGSGGGGVSTSEDTLGGSGTANQGYDGAIGQLGGAEGSPGGGGGAGQVGQTGIPSPGNYNTTGGSGGNGLASTITGSSIYRAGGGGAGSYEGTKGSGGLGGGGAGARDLGGTQAQSGTANTGGGGGGACHQRNSTINGGSGGSGVVILRMPTAKYTGTYTGAETPIVDGSDTILVFNSSGSYTG
jgi:hypothetical protein